MSKPPDSEKSTSPDFARLNAWLDAVRDAWPSRGVRCGCVCLRLLGWSLITTFFGWAAMATQQGRDGLRVFLAGSVAHLLAGALLLALWCFLSGYFARATERYVLTPSQRDGIPLALRVHVPRLLPLLPALAVAQVLLTLPHAATELERTGLGNVWAALAAIAIGGAMVLLMYLRAGLISRFQASRLGKVFGQAMEPKLPHTLDARISRFGAVAAVGRVFIFSVNLLWLAAFAGSIVAPIAIGRTLGPFLLIAGGCISVLGIGFWGALMAKRLELPLFRIVLAVIVLIQVLPLGWNIDSYDIRVTAPRSSGDRETLEAALARWEGDKSELQRRTLVIVATAGGGIRAAQWTSTVLATLGERFPAFNRSLFAISGVSGGALGATFYAASLHPDAVACLASRGGNEATSARLRAGVLAAMGGDDYLSPPLYRLLFSDLLSQAFNLDLPDRAAALEQSWERSWALRWSDLGGDACAGAATLFGRAFLALWADAAKQNQWLPELLLNGTSMGSGQRLVTTAIDLPRPAPELVPAQQRVLLKLPPFDLFDVLCSDIPVSTAANNAARFPLVEPAGRLTLRSDCSDAASPALQHDRIVDGGYFENFGADTARNLILEIAGLLRGRPSSQRPNLLVVLISSDPEVGAILKDSGGPDLGEPPGAFTDLLGPAYAVYAARTAHGVEASYRLSEAVADLQQLAPDAFARIGLAEFSLEALGEIAQPVREAPLGWILTPRTAEAIAQALQPGSITPANQRALSQSGQVLQSP